MKLYYFSRTERLQVRANSEEEAREHLGREYSSWDEWELEDVRDTT